VGGERIRPTDSISISIYLQTIYTLLYYLYYLSLYLIYLLYLIYTKLIIIMISSISYYISLSSPMHVVSTQVIASIWDEASFLEDSLSIILSISYCLLISCLSLYESSVDARE
jgi:hypothetical protein